MKVNENKASGIVRVVAITMALLFAAIPVPLKAQGNLRNLPPAGNEPPEISAEELAKIDNRLAVLMNLRHQWIARGFPVKLADEMRDRINNFSQCLDIHRKFLEGLEFELNQGKVELVTGEERRILPPRNFCSDIPGHVTCFKEHNGLIHGGVIKMPNGTLVCRAYRLTYMRRYHGSHSYKRDEHREAVAAGVCEKKDSAGKVVERWSTADILPLQFVSKGYYSSTSVGLPPPAVQRILYEKDGKRWNMAWFGYYFPSGWDGVNGYDNGNPTYEHWSSLGGAYIWDFPPAHNTAVESPTYNFQENCTPGFVICSSYLKVFHPDPTSSEAIVCLIGAYRQQSQRKTAVNFHNRHAEWYVKTFR